MQAPVRTNPPVPMWLVSIAFVSTMVASYLIFFWVSTEVTMGIIQRIFYFHVSAAMVAFWAVFVGGISSLLYLKTRDMQYDDLAAAANESVVIFSAINIILGSIWGRRAWGLWWTWDARLTSSLLLTIIYCTYVIARKAIPAEQRGTTSAVICMFGMADVPLIYMSNRIFRTQHPSPVIGGGEGSGLAADMLVTLLVSTVAMLLVWWCIVRLRRRVVFLERRLESLSRNAYQFIGSREG